MPDQTPPASSPLVETQAQRMIRERQEKDLQAKDNDHLAKEEASKRQLSGAGKSEVKGEVLKDEETPTLRKDGSRSPHDASSDGGSRQGAAHKQLADAEKAASDADAAKGGKDSAGGVVTHPTEEQAKQAAITPKQE